MPNSYNCYIVAMAVVVDDVDVVVAID